MFTENSAYTDIAKFFFYEHTLTCHPFKSHTALFHNTAAADIIDHISRFYSIQAHSVKAKAKNGDEKQETEEQEVEEKKVTAVECMSQLGVGKTTFYKLRKQYLDNKK